MIFRFILLYISILCSNISYASHEKVIYIYNDAGAGQESVKQAFNTVKKTAPKIYSVKMIDAAEVLKGKWTKQAAIFVMPGGAATPYAKKLNGKGNQIIKQYVANGGAYLGMCAGGYYGSSIIEFDKHGPLEIITTAELSFFPGKAIGPVLAPYDYQSNSGARVAPIQLHLSSHIASTYLYFNGGGYFKDAASYPHTTVLGFYQTKNGQLPAIIKINYGKGVVILSGVHFEYSPALLNKSDPYLVPLLPFLQRSEAERLVFFADIFNELIQGKI